MKCIGIEIALPSRWRMRNNITVRGQWIYLRDAVSRFIAPLRSGLLLLDNVDATEFPLPGINEAIAHAGAHAGACKLTVLYL